MLLKALLIGLLLLIAEVINGNIRVRLWHRQFGKQQAKQLSFLSGVALIYTLCWFTLPWVSPRDFTDCYRVGLVWLLMMLLLEIYFAKQVFKLSWANIIEDFNPLKGNLLSLGMLLLFFSPAVVFSLQS